MDIPTSEIDDQVLAAYFASRAVESSTSYDLPFESQLETHEAQFDTQLLAHEEQSETHDVWAVKEELVEISENDSPVLSPLEQPEPSTSPILSPVPDLNLDNLDAYPVTEEEPPTVGLPSRAPELALSPYPLVADDGYRSGDYGAATPSSSSSACLKANPTNTCHPLQAHLTTSASSVVLKPAPSFAPAVCLKAKRSTQYPISTSTRSPSEASDGVGNIKIPTDQILRDIWLRKRQSEARRQRNSRRKKLAAQQQQVHSTTTKATIDLPKPFH